MSTPRTRICIGLPQLIITPFSLTSRTRGEQIEAVAPSFPSRFAARVVEGRGEAVCVCWGLGRHSGGGFRIRDFRDKQARIEALGRQKKVWGKRTEEWVERFMSL